MTSAKILSILAKYEQFFSLIEYGVEPRRIDPSRTFESCTKQEILSHARYLVENFKNINVETQCGKANRHLAAIQMCLSFAGIFTLQDLMNHNRPE